MSVTFDDLIKSSSEKEFLQIFQKAFSYLDQSLLEAHRTILVACYQNPGLSPTLKSSTPEALAQSWLKKYCDSYERRISQPPGTIADPIVNTIINARINYSSPLTLREEFSAALRHALLRRYRKGRSTSKQVLNLQAGL